MSEFTIEINGQVVPASAGQTVLQVAKSAGIKIPTLCYHPDLPAMGACRVCLVEIEARGSCSPSCSFPVRRV